MSWHGIGLISGNWATLPDMGSIYAPPARIVPAATWAGTAGSGFTSPPIDPVRTSAKPALRLLTPPFQFFTDTIDVGVMAMANNGGTLLDTFGIASVRFLFEGGEAVVTQPTFHSVRTQRGPRTYFGWWVRLRKPPSKAGQAHLYVEATPRDATMQKRVIGPFLFSPVNQKYTASVTVTPSQPEVAGVNYQTLDAAATYLNQQNALNPLVTITEPGLYELTVGSGTPGLSNRKTGPGRLNITASVPGVSIGRATYTNDAAAEINDARYKLCFFGTNLTLDWRRIRIVEGDSTDLGNGAWLDGCNMTSTAPYGEAEPWRGSYTPNLLGAVQGGVWMTEVAVDRVRSVGINAALARGCDIDRCSGDIFSVSTCAVWNRVRRHNSDFNTEQQAFTVVYTGPEATATLSRSGGPLSSGTGGGVFTLTIGAASHTFDVGSSATEGNEPYFTGALGDGYFISDVVNWLNTFPNVTATLLLDENDSFQKRHAGSCGLPGTGGNGFTNASIKTTPLLVAVAQDIHADFYQHNGGALENVIVAFNQLDKGAVQFIFLSPFNAGVLPTERDIFFVGNAGTIQEETFPGNNPIGLFSQFGRGTGLAASHVVIAHNTLTNQGLLIRTSGIAAGSTVDAYCLIKNNTFRLLGYDAAGPQPGLAIDGLHIHAGNPAPANASNVVVGGNATTLFADYLNADFAPVGLLAANGFVPAIPLGINRTAFPSLTAIGALGLSAPEYIVQPAINSPTIAGTPQDGQVLTATATITGGGQLSGNAPAVSYKWQRNGTNIAGQTGAMITLNAATMGLSSGDTISCEITASNVAGTVTAEPSVQFVGAARVALATLLSGKTGSGMYDGRAATNTGTLTVTNISGAFGSYSQTAAAQQPAISLTLGLDFDGANDLLNALSVGGTYTFLALLRKDVGANSKHIIANALIPISGSSTAQTGVTVDGAASATRGALFTQLNDGAWHIVQWNGVASGTTPSLGHPTSAHQGEILAWVVLREGQFTNIAAARTAAYAWLMEEKP